MKKTFIIIIFLLFISNTVGGLGTVYYNTTFYGDHLELTFASNGYDMSYLEVGSNYFNIQCVFDLYREKQKYRFTYEAKPRQFN